MPSDAMRSYLRLGAEAVRRHGGQLSVPDDADDQRAAAMLRSAFINASDVVAKFDGLPFYPDDHDWSYGWFSGLSRAKVSSELELARNPSLGSLDDWAIAARVQAGEAVFDVPIAFGLEETSARNIMEKLEGREADMVDIDLIARAFPQTDVSVMFWGGNQADVREIGVGGTLAMDVALDFRRPAVWDEMRARLSSLPATPLPAFAEADFNSRMSMSMRYDTAAMRSMIANIGVMARRRVDPGGAAWAEWFPMMLQMFGLVGKAQPVVGMSVLVDMVVQEPLADGSDWKAVGIHSVCICCGLDPLAAVAVHDEIEADPTVFVDLPDTDRIRYRPLKASIIQDSMLSSRRASLHGRTSRYDEMVVADDDARTSAPSLPAPVEREAAQTSSAPASASPATSVPVAPVIPEDDSDIPF